jgi:hypothetical protein
MHVPNSGLRNLSCSSAAIRRLLRDEAGAEFSLGAGNGWCQPAATHRTQKERGGTMFIERIAHRMLLLFGILLCAAAGSASVSFRPAVNYKVGANPSNVTVGDRFRRRIPPTLHRKALWW